MNIYYLAVLSAWAGVGGDTTPGGIASALLQEDGTFGFLLEDGSSDLLLE